MTNNIAATYYSGIEDLTEENLQRRIKIGFNNWLKDCPEDTVRVTENLEKLPEALAKYWKDKEHGFPHTFKVAARIDSLLPDCPNMIRSMKMFNVLPIDIAANLAWTAILHDLGYFFGYSFAEHQKFAAELVKYAFWREVPEYTLACLVSSIGYHDYFSTVVNKSPLPEAFIENPLAEIFRLADKTTGSVAEEIWRYYQTNKLYNLVFFDPTISLQRRLELNNVLLDLDSISIFLYLFTITPKDFFYAETARLYHEWETSNTFRNRGKRGAYLAIKQLTLVTEKLGLPAWQEIEGIYRQFFEHYKLPHPLQK